MAPQLHCLPLAVIADNATLLLSLALFVLFVHVLLWIVYVCLRFERHEWLIRMLDVENCPNGSLWRATHAALLGKLATKPEIPLSRNTIASRVNEYQLRHSLGQGDLCRVWVADLPNQSFVLKIPRVDHCNDLMAQEQRLLREFRHAGAGNGYARYFPELTESFWSADRRVSAFPWNEQGHTGQAIRRQHVSGVSPRHIGWMFNRTLEALGFVHQQGYIHGAILPQHLLFDVRTHGLQILDWIHAVNIGQTLSLAPRVFKSWYPPECHRGRAVTPATDIYLAAKTMLWMAGESPNETRFHKNLPCELSRLFGDCLRSNPRHRPQDAWELHEQFGELLEQLFGAPVFCHLSMS